MRSILKLAAITGATLAAIACSSGTSGNNSGFSHSDASANDVGDDNGNNGNGDDGGTNGSITGDNNGDSGKLNVGNPPPVMEAGTVITKIGDCNGTSAMATRLPVNLVVVLDQSWSMGDDTKSGSTPVGWQTRWAPVTQALDQFFEDPNSTGISASLTFFPLGTPDSAADNSSPMCSSNYTTPAVGLTGLPVTGDDPFADAINANGPESAMYNPDGVESDTPTKNALVGAYNYAAAQQAADTSGAVYAVVLVTDGDPCGCDYASACPSKGGTASIITAAATDIANNTIAPELASANIPTYVIGIGPDGVNLNLFASAGGTNAAINVSTSSGASTTSTQLITALDGIRTKAISCNYPIPQLDTDGGQTYDLSQVNVNYTAGDGTVTTLPYDQDCTMNGWHFDSTTNPTQVELCGSTCTELKSDGSASVSVVFGCMTTTIIPGYDGGVTIR